CRHLPEADKIVPCGTGLMCFPAPPVMVIEPVDIARYNAVVRATGYKPDMCDRYGAAEVDTCTEITHERVDIPIIQVFRAGTQCLRRTLDAYQPPPVNRAGIPGRKYR